LQEAEFIEVLKRHGNLIHQICYSYCQTPDLRKDLQQEILIQLWRSLQRFDGGVKLSTWVYKIGLNVAISFQRKESKYRREIGIDDCKAVLEVQQDSVADREEIRYLYSFISKLSALEKGLVLLYLDGYPYKEISEIIGISETNVSTKVSRIKKALRLEFDRINLIKHGTK
jgi:RNA polymerase sigma factor (sigma-70 family)